MIETDPGHLYELDLLDLPEEARRKTATLRFVKREGPKYPGNKGHYPGTTIQEVLRACVARLKYVDNQIPCEEDKDAIKACMEAVWLLEERAAIRHGRLAPTLEEALTGPTCPNCKHVGCQGECH